MALSWLQPCRSVGVRFWVKASLFLKASQSAAAARLQRKEEELRRRWQTAGQTPSGPSLDWLTRRVERLLALEQPDRPLLGQLLRGIFVGENGRVELRLAFSGPKGETENSITF